MSDRIDKPKLTIVPPSTPVPPAPEESVEESRKVEWIGVGRFTPQALLATCLDRANGNEYKHVVVLAVGHDNKVYASWSAIPNQTLAYASMQFQAELHRRFMGEDAVEYAAPPHPEAG